MEIDLCPRWLLSKFSIPECSQRDFSLFVSSLLALFVAPAAARFPHLCLVQYLFRLPCPGCGITHSLIAIMTLHASGAWHANPAGFVVASCFCFQVVARPIAIVSSRMRNRISAISYFVSRVALGSLLVVWAVRIV